MSLPWCRLDNSFGQNPKVLDLMDRGKHRAVLVYVFALSYCSVHATDGVVPRAALPFIHGRPADARELVTAGLWEAYDNGWLVHDYLDYQPGKGAYRDKRRAACERWMRQGKPCSCGQHLEPDQLRAVQ